MARSLSKRESEVILEMEWSGKKIVTINEVMTILGCPYDYAKKIVQRLVEKNWLDPISKGKYLLVSASSGKEGIPSSNALLIGSFLVEPYYFSYATSNSYYGFSPQMPSTIYIVTTKSKRLTRIHGATYRFIRLSDRKFFGYKKVKVFDADVSMADKEKSIVDSIDKMKYSGGIREVVEIIKVGIRKVDIDKLLDYACKMGSSSLVQRLGFLLESLKVEFDDEFLIQHIGKSIVYLSPNGKKKGNYNKRWKIICNVSLEEFSD
jgi:predicted transcriptional regulator of viral defense system